MHTHTYTHTYTYECIYMCIHTYVCVYMCICICVCMSKYELECPSSQNWLNGRPKAYLSTFFFFIWTLSFSSQAYGVHSYKK